MQLLTLAGSIFFVIYSVVAQNAEDAPPCTQALLNAGKPMPGKYLPQCTDFGFFKPTQCHGSTGRCWCVNPVTGTAVDGSSTMRNGMPQCTMCHVKMAELLRPFGFVGGYVPTCTEDGLFQTTQTHGSTGYSWCVDRYTGEELLNTRVGPGQQRSKSCNDAAMVAAFAMHSALPEQGPCYSKMVEARGRDSMPGFYTPACTANGFFKTQQYHGSTGYTWCVNPTTGVEVTGTRRSPSQTKVTCGACFMETETKLTRKPLMGGELSQCNQENGDYLPVQHREGFSWCANPKTGAVEGAKNAPGDKTPLPCVNL